MLIRSPATEAEFEAYYALRWKLLREPWNQPPGSERDEFEGRSIHLAAWDDDGNMLGIGRLHSFAPNRGQVRYMAVQPSHRSRGIGKALLEELEVRAIESGILDIIVNSREDAVPFYQRNGYKVLRPAHTLFGAIRHFEMGKRLI